jgi:pyruvate dehydrogenase E2 component (dihydrolipoamide acetyltransferase)
MAIEIKVPDLGEGIESGDVLEVFVSEGEIIEKDQSVVELETDKATVSVPSSAAGKVTKVSVQSGETVSVGAVLIEVEASEAAAAPVVEPEAAPAAPEPAPAPTPEPEPVVAQEPAVPATPSPATPSPATPSPATPPPAAPPTPVAAPVPAPTPPPAPVAVQPAAAAIPATPPIPAASASDAAVAAGPAIRRFAREVGVDLGHVVGTGESGRITREDILNAVRQANRGGTVTQTAMAPSTGAAESSAASAQAAATGDQDSWGPIRRERMSRMRKTIAEQMHRSWSTVPRVTNFDDADVTDLEEFRQSSKDDYAAQGIKLTTMPFLIKAVAMALRTNPALNANVDMDQGEIIYKEYVNLGIAVDTDRGLVVPNLRNADRMSIPDIARQLSLLAENARTNNFTIDDTRGGTFTISNLGAIGGTYSTPIVNVPETAILLVGRSRKMPVVIGDDIQVRLMMPLSLSYDHRLVDGATAARFLNEVIGYLKAPSRLLLAL